MRIIAISTLKTFYLRHPETETGIKVWIQKVRRADWTKPEDILNSFSHARPIGVGRVVFNINQNDYRLIVLVQYERKSVFICFIGTHGQYDKIDPKTVWDY